MFILTTFFLTKLINNTNEKNLQKITSLHLLVVEVLSCKGWVLFWDGDKNSYIEGSVA